MSIESLEKLLEERLLPTSLIEVADEKIVVCSGAYDAGDVVSESTTAGTPWLFRNVVRENGGAGRIHDALVLAQTTAIASVFSMFLHKARPTCALNDDAANTAFILADKDIAVVRIDFTACDDVGTGMSESTATPSTYGKLPKTFVCNPHSRDLYGVMAIHNAVDLADNTILRVILWIEQL